MFRESYDGQNKKIFWQEMWRDEFETALRITRSAWGESSTWPAVTDFRCPV